MNKVDTPALSPLDVLQERIDLLKKFQHKIELSLEKGGGTHTFDFVCEQVITGQMLTLHSDHSIMVLEVMHFPLKKVLNVFIAAGEGDAVLDMHNDLIRLARKHGCSTVSTIGRKGWRGRLDKLGWQNPLAYWTIEVNDG